jgi:hypothetical protein
LAITDPGGAWDLGDGGLDVGTGDFSIAAWVIFDSVGADGFPSIMFKGGGSSTNAGYWYGHETSVDGLRLAVSDGTNRFIANSNPALGLDDTNWHHVTVVFDREAGTDTAYFYLDGTPVGSEASALIAGNSATGTNDVGIGASATGTRPWKGSIDDPRIYDYALSAGEITALAASAPGPCTIPAVTSAVAEISPTDVTTSSTGNSFSYDIQATISGSATGVDTVAITVPGSFGAPTQQHNRQLDQRRHHDQDHGQ